MATIAPTIFTDTDPHSRHVVEPPIKPNDDVAWRAGPVTRSRLRRTGMLYLLLIAIGLAPLLVDASAGWQAAGLGLWFPGGGFIAVGGWALLLFPLVIVLFGLGFFAWFGSGMILGPILVWLGSAVVAGLMAGPTIWTPSPYVVAALVVAFALDNRRRTRARHAVDAETMRARIVMQPAADAALAARAIPAPADAVGELDPDNLAAVRYLYDRALQPNDDFGGYDIKDIFQTAALRYQINLAGYALAQVQAQYTPNFHGYLSEAQRALIEKYLLPRVWNYWVYESIWGHFNFTNWDPAGKDNIMLTGYYVPQMALYTATTGDDRYAEPGNLVFRLSKSLSWKHDVHSINQSLVDNFRRSAFCLYPCEPNWIYPGCNLRGMSALASHDLAYGTSYVEEFAEPFLHNFETEFTNGAGSVVPLRSSVTGIPLPFPGSDASYSSMINIFAPNRARRKWALGAAEIEDKIKLIDGVPMLDLPNDGIDFGNYKKGALTFGAASLMNSASEFGDTHVAEAARNTLDHRCGRTMKDGVLSYVGGSNLANITAITARISRRDGIRNLFNQPRGRGALRGPLLSEARYPDVLVARAASAGEDLDLVLYGTPDGSQQSIGLSRLQPGARYEVDARPDLHFTADARGCATIKVTLSGRTPLHIRPV